jgi:hypothetical protein
VVRVAVRAVVVVGHDHLRADLADHRDQRRRRLGQVGLPERARVVVLRGPHHPAVPPAAFAAEPAVVAQAERLRRGRHLAHPVLAERVRPVVVQVLEVVHDDLAGLAAGAGDDGHVRALGGVLGDRHAGGDALVVRVRVDEQDAALGHASTPANRSVS